MPEGAGVGGPAASSGSRVRFQFTALCCEGPAGVFQRSYSLSTPRLGGCSFEAVLPFSCWPQGGR